MVLHRRSTDRRRRVLYSAHVASQHAATTADRRNADRWRGARQSAGAFGSRVNRHLRGRWFSLVPVSGIAIAAFFAAVTTIAVSLTIAHHLAITSPWLAAHPEVARPLRLDRPDSFGAYWTGMLLFLSAGVTYLIYGLRLHRRDDYRGHYQLWRWTTAVLLAASVHQAVGLVGWLGAVLELILGDRAILSGANWLRIVLDVGGIVLAMRLAVELYRCRRALAAMLVALTIVGWAELAAWQIVRVDSPLEYTLSVAAPLLAASATLLATTFYLRALFRQVRGISEGPPLRQRFESWLDRWRKRGEDDDDWELRLVRATEEIAAPPAATRTRTAPRREPDDAKPEPDEDAEAAAASQGDDDAETAPAKTRRRAWLSRLPWPKRKPSAAADETTGEADEPADDPAEDAVDEADSAAVDSPRRKRWFSLRLAPKRPAANDPNDATPNDAAKSSRDNAAPAGEDSSRGSETHPASSDQAADSAEPAKPKAGWLSRLGRRRNPKPPAEQSTESVAGQREAAAAKDRDPPAKPSSRPPQQRRDRGANEEGEALPPPDEIDWESMSKAERRRMRKQLKRAGRAA